MLDDDVHPKSHWVRLFLFSFIVLMSLALQKTWRCKGNTLAAFTGKVGTMLRATAVKM